MTSYDKVVKLACKPKANAPKPKYLDPIIAATWSEEGAVADVCKSLAPRFREPNAIVVFKALIVLHTMIRNGATDNVLSHLSSSEVLRLRNVSSGNWDGYATPENLQHYAVYLDTRIRAYRELNHDAVKVQSENNRDMRVSVGLEQGYEREKNHGGSSKGKSSKAAPSAAVQRSKTMMGRKLRIMSVDKGLLRETTAVQKMIDSLVECRFYLDDLEDELNITALRMLVKDLLILFQAGNEGVINLLEHYFEMSHVDAESALQIYRHFCTQTELVVEFLGVAKKLQNLLNVEIPNLKHAPVSLAGALQEYLNDPAFEQNRLEYKANKEAADRSSGSTARGGSKTVAKSTTGPNAPTKPIVPPVPAIPASASSSSAAPVPPEQNKSIIDFFSAIEEEQPTMFNPQTGSPTAQYFNQQAASNPFVQMQMTGAFPNGMQPFAMPPQQANGFPMQGTGFPMQMQPQPTGFPMQPQQTGFNPFAQAQQQQQQPQHRPFAAFVPQPTGFPPQQQQGIQPQPTGFLQPQPTGSNPFRQSMAFNSSFTVVPPQMSPPANAFSGQSSGPQQQFSPSGQQHVGAGGPSSGMSGNTPFGHNANTAMQLPPRPASTPLNAFPSAGQRSASPPTMQAVKTHQTGTKNPFGQAAPAPPPPVPKQPSMMEIAMGGGPQQFQQFQQQQQQQAPVQQQKTGGFNAFAAFNVPQGGSNISSVASSFVAGNSASPTSSSAFNPLLAQNTSTTFSSDSMFSSQPTGTTTTSISPNMSASSAAPLKPQGTGFGGIKAFVPLSSFGATLLETLPAIPQPASSTPAAGLPNQTTGFSGFNPSVNVNGGGFGGSNVPPFNPGGATGGAFGGQVGGSSLGQGLRPQTTGGTAANPFRMSTMSPPGSGGVPPLPSGSPAFGGQNGSSVFGAQNGGPAFGRMNGAPTGNTPSFGANLFGGQQNGNLGSGFNPNQQQQQPNNDGSLI